MNGLKITNIRLKRWRQRFRRPCTGPFLSRPWDHNSSRCVQNKGYWICLTAETRRPLKVDRHKLPVVYLHRITLRHRRAGDGVSGRVRHTAGPLTWFGTWGNTGSCGCRKSNARTWSKLLNPVFQKVENVFRPSFVIFRNIRQNLYTGTLYEKLFPERPVESRNGRLRSTNRHRRCHKN
jgi:hypothetical protein